MTISARWLIFSYPTLMQPVRALQSTGKSKACFTWHYAFVKNSLHFTRSNLYRNQIEQLASGNQDGMRNVSQKNMKLVEFPIPKLEEQAEIVRLLDDLLDKEQQAKEAAEGVLEQIDLIKKAILARAFRGELDTNDPNEESAVSLLR